MRPEWLKVAPCRGMGRLFAGQGTAQAAALCDGCPYTDRCLDYLLRSPHQAGYGGGMTAPERRRLRRQRRTSGSLDTAPPTRVR